MPHPKVKISDDSGNTVGVTGNRLDVNLAAADVSIDIGDVEVKGHAAIGHGGNIDIDSGDDEQITAVSTPCKHVDIMASIANSCIVYIGGEDVTGATGIALYAGDVYSIDIDNLNLIYARSSIDNQRIQWVYYN